ncbi:hypothetical protein E6C76_18640 [Pseudothauera nasutitermitis]|uniref:Uncharacterized protein n=1 Tax=Pseudothauera nasutitermitis TaxID=2565930 RepID=A0A4S4AT50_9RHOO|nr:hypothetical protein [Pseudothauera nasutitermitis]THF62339.1 hypothetical protein E6C76_18640 [Pseudothauera nasutitermitis]
MRRETAYRLAGRRHDHPVGGAGIRKARELRFKALPPGQVERAWLFLGLLKGVQVERLDNPLALGIRYSVLEYSLESIEDALSEAGFRLDNTLYMKLVRALVYFCEETQRHNLESPERLLKKSNEAYVQAWDQHAHGDHDDAPPELREYK